MILWCFFFFFFKVLHISENIFSLSLFNIFYLFSIMSRLWTNDRISCFLCWNNIPLQNSHPSCIKHSSVRGHLGPAVSWLLQLVPQWAWGCGFLRPSYPSGCGFFSFPFQKCLRSWMICYADLQNVLRADCFIRGCYLGVSVAGGELRTLLLHLPPLSVSQENFLFFLEFFDPLVVQWCIV